MSGEYIGKHAPKESDPWGEFALEMKEYEPKHAKPEEAPVEAVSEEAGAEEIERAPQTEEVEELEEMPSFDEHMEKMEDEGQIEPERLEAKEEEAAEKQKLVNELEMAREDLLRAERDFEETGTRFDKLVSDLEMVMDDPRADVTDMQIALKRAREAMEDFGDASNKFDKAIDGFSFYNQRAVMGEAVSERTFEENRDGAMADFEKVNAAKMKINKMDDSLERARRKIYAM